MQFRIGATLCLLALLALALVATGQPMVDAVDIVPEVDWAVRIEALITVWLPRVVMLAGVLTAIFPSGNKVMRVLDGLAINWGKARNDPGAQKWGK